MRAILSSNRSGFTLVELSIVIIIIGLVVGGVVGGQSLIASSERSAIIREYNGFVTGIRAYKLEYDALPGDHSDAEDYFGSGNTDNGGGDGLICCYGEVRGAVDVIGEGPVWNHLSLAEIIGGEFNAVTSDVMDGTEGPESPTGSADRWVINYMGQAHAGRWWDSSDNAFNLYSRKQGQYIAIGGGGDANDYRDGVISGKGMRSIDKKIDDGEPDSGSVFATKGYDGSNYQAGCVDGEPDASAATDISYDLANESESCRPLFFVSF